MAQQTFKVDFMRYAPVMLALSGVLVLVSILALAVRGLNFGIDFTGGTLVEVQYPAPVELPQVQAALSGHGLEGAVVQYFGTRSEVLVRIPAGMAGSTGELSTRVLEALGSGGQNITLQRVEFVGPQVGDELVTNAALALLYAVLAIGAYVAFRFEYRFAIGAVVSLAHDAIITVGFCALVGLEFDLTVVAAVLTVIGYSINDTVVIYDRIRENFPRMRKASTREVINRSVNETMTRTIATTATVVLALLPLVLFGGDAIHSFSLAMLIGVLAGAYSTIYVASWSLLPTGLSARDMIAPVKEGAQTP
ncbi:protein translocase subunit SecF [Immundisolibacter cernigliae]|uniref:Protein-export membrane protein SecF n=1 Tax=Immundisolibacter cernigliae TaxID=1810504 RepID=A0A1B1YTX1_9GAMM|nr:protein translocase subunit SecF [Immundisolibacter cernigliae]ANX04157.1 preprotein translocase subunit SecF [Immundisolibacter cernigliae]